MCTAVLAFVVVIAVIVMNIGRDSAMKHPREPRPGDTAAAESSKLSVSWGLAVTGDEVLAAQPVAITSDPRRTLTAAHIVALDGSVAASGVVVSAVGPSAVAEVAELLITAVSGTRLMTTRLGPIVARCQGSAAVTRHPHFAVVASNVTVVYPPPQAFHATGAVVTVADTAKRHVSTISVADVTCRQALSSLSVAAPTTDAADRVGTHVDPPVNVGRCGHKQC